MSSARFVFAELAAIASSFQADVALTHSDALPAFVINRMSEAETDASLREAVLMVACTSKSSMQAEDMGEAAVARLCDGKVRDLPDGRTIRFQKGVVDISAYDTSAGTFTREFELRVDW